MLVFLVLVCFVSQSSALKCWSCGNGNFTQMDNIPRPKSYVRQCSANEFSFNRDDTAMHRECLQPLAACVRIEYSDSDRFGAYRDCFRHLTKHIAPRISGEHCIDDLLNGIIARVCICHNDFCNGPNTAKSLPASLISSNVPNAKESVKMDALLFTLLVVSWTLEKIIT